MQNDKKYSLTGHDIRDNGIQAHLERILQEFSDGFEFLKKYPKSVSIFGSSEAMPEMEHYKMAQELGGRIVRELKYAVITGGGPGIMEAANKGAYDAGGPSLGLNISLPHEWTTNAYCTHAIKFSYFFARKTMLTFAAETFVFFPGGFGTMDELFSILTLIQTEKIPRVPIILFDSKYWNDFKAFLSGDLLRKFGTIDPGDLHLFEITDSLDRAMEIIKKAPLSEWWRNIN
ncbi:TIGR00730 family Rossman fold protein [Patescibacteria group bacterium]|nr:TIGR00730 family Rossman fold protein [Patescibacteria group bacterium]MDE1946385.1 TIGR00730 family Rossman fold protein [Patescibacteria group bacterium]MDE2010837.1 TIGR00730 family Rossman fold protein [Patescibacteria group bacterium]MDE2233103.1 TIGR00730 family Rossman fold protein [Patescibacteria group bacterium]